MVRAFDMSGGACLDGASGGASRFAGGICGRGGTGCLASASGCRVDGGWVGSVFGFRGAFSVGGAAGCRVWGMESGVSVFGCRGAFSRFGSFGWRLGGIASGAFSVRFSFFAS